MTPLDKQINKIVDQRLSDWIGQIFVPQGLQNFARRQSSIPSRRIDQQTQPDDRVRSSIVTLTPVSSNLDANTPPPFFAPPVSDSNPPPQTFGFQALSQDFGSGYVVGVYTYSNVSNITATQQIQYPDLNSPSGILTAPNAGAGDPGWMPTSTSDFIWCTFEFDTSNWPNVLTFKIESLVTGGSFGGGANGGLLEYATLTGPAYVQHYLRMPIATMTADANGNPTVQYQWALGNVLLETMITPALDSTGANPKVIPCQYRRT